MSEAWRDTYDAWKLRSDRDEYPMEEDTDMDPETNEIDFATELTNLIARHLEGGATADEIIADMQDQMDQLQGSSDAETPPEDEADG